MFYQHFLNFFYVNNKNFKIFYFYNLLYLVKMNNYIIDNILYSFTNNNDVIAIEQLKLSGINSFYPDENINYIVLISDNKYKNRLFYEYFNYKIIRMSKWSFY